MNPVDLETEKETEDRPEINRKAEENGSIAALAVLEAEKEGRLQQFQKVFCGDLAGFEDFCQSGAFDRFMSGNCNLQGFIPKVLMETDMAAFLSDDYKTGALESPNNAVVAQDGDRAQRETSATSLLGSAAVSSSAGSRYSSMASRMFFRASSFVSPSLMHPGREGTYTVKPPSGEDSSITLIFINATSLSKYNRNPVFPQRRCGQAAKGGIRT